MLKPALVGSGSPGRSAQIAKSKAGTPISVRSIPKTSQMVPSSKGATRGRTATATLVSTPSACHTGGGKSMARTIPARSPGARQGQVAGVVRRKPALRGALVVEGGPAGCQRGHRVQQPVDVLEGVGQAHARPDGGAGGFGGVGVQQRVDQQVGTELAVADADAVLGREGRRHQ